MPNELDQLNLQSTLPPEIYQQQQALNRQQQLASMLMQQGQQQPQGQMISGRYVAPSFFQNILPLVQTGVGAYKAKQGDVEAAKLAEQLRTGRQSEQVAIMEALNTGDTKKALALASGSTYGGGKEFVPALIGSVIPKKTDKLIEYEQYKAETPPDKLLKFTDWADRNEKERLAIDKQRLGLEGARLGLEREKLAAEMGGGKLTESQGNATAFGMRAKEANAIATGLEKKGITDTGLTRATIAGGVGGTPFIGEHLENTANTLLNWTASPEQQQTKQARQNFITAVLRKESGATIRPDEFRVEEEKYFPKINDSAQVIKQKQEAREAAIRALEIQAGPGAKFIKESGAPQKVVNFNDLP